MWLGIIVYCAFVIIFATVGILLLVYELCIHEHIVFISVICVFIEM